MTVGSVDVEAGKAGYDAAACRMERNGGGGEHGRGDDERCGGGAGFMEEWCCACARLFLGPNPMLARYMYALIFLVTNLLAWTARDYGNFALAELQRLKVCHGSRACFGAEGVLRISLGCFLFFFVMFLSTVNARKVHDWRNSWHSEWWPAKLVLWLGFTAIAFFAPSPLVQLYGKVAHFGAGAFLVIQLVSVTRFIMWLNDCCRSEVNQKKCHMQILVVSVGAYVCSILGIVLMYVWYAPSLTCKINILFITITLILVLLMTLVSMSSKFKAGYLAPGLMGVYVVFLCWSAIRR